MQTVRRAWISSTALVLCACGQAPASDETLATAASDTTTLRWEVVHAPNDYFIQMAALFEEIVERDTDGRVQVEVLDETGCFADRHDHEDSSSRLDAKREDQRDLQLRVRDRAKKAGLIPGHRNLRGVALRRAEGLQKLQMGNVEIAQDYTFHLAKVANVGFQALELPYLFDGYEHVDATLEGEPGERLLTSMVEDQGYRGLAYTFSGGLLVNLSSSDAPFTTLESWSGQRFRVEGSSIRARTLKVLGSEVVSLLKQVQSGSPRGTLLIAEGTVDALEVNLPDVEHWLSDELESSDASLNLGKPNRRQRAMSNLAITETQHTLLSTVLLIREDAFQSMSEEDQAVVKAAALEAGRFERNLTIERGERAEARLRAAGFPWFDVSAETRAEVRAAAQPVYDKLFKEVPAMKAVVEEIGELATVSTTDADTGSNTGGHGQHADSDSLGVE